jgi:hypothetical protein
LTFNNLKIRSRTIEFKFIYKKIRPVAITIKKGQKKNEYSVLMSIKATRLIARTYKYCFKSFNTRLSSETSNNRRFNIGNTRNAKEKPAKRPVIILISLVPVLNCRRPVPTSRNISEERIIPVTITLPGGNPLDFLFPVSHMKI